MLKKQLRNKGAKRLAAAILTAGILLFGLSGCRQRETLAKQGIDQLHRQDYAAAEQSFRDALEEHAFLDGIGDTDLLKYLIQAQMGQQSYDGAQSTCEQILEKDPGDGETLVLAGRCALSLGDTEKAREYFQRAQECDAQDASYYMGQCLEAAGNYQEASASYEKQLEKDPDSAESCIRLAVCYIEMSDLNTTPVQGQGQPQSTYPESGQKALAAAQKGLAMSPDEEEKRQLLYLEAVSYEYMEDYAAAREKMGAYVEAYPDDQKAAKEYAFLKTR